MTFAVNLSAPLSLALKKEVWIAEAESLDSFEGVFEGDVSSEEAADLGFETESWVIDSAQAPAQRDWVNQRVLHHSHFQMVVYFGRRNDADQFCSFVGGDGTCFIEEIAPQDWNRISNASFQDFEIHPGYWICPPWSERTPRVLQGKDSGMIINPGAGFGTGTHETTRLCFRAMASCGFSWAGKTVLDFGSGSGILSFHAAKLGASQVIGVEIDPLAIDNADDNARWNGLQDRVQFKSDLSQVGSECFDVVVANILRPVLLEYAEALMRSLKPGGNLILSGLIESDLPQVMNTFESLGLIHVAAQSLGEWRSVLGTKR